MWLFVLFVTLLLLYIVHQLTPSNNWAKIKVKYVKPLPFFGNMLPIVTKSLGLCEFIQTIYNKFPEERYVGFFEFRTPVLFLRDTELIKNITIKNFDNFVDHRGFISAEADPLWGKNLFTSEGERWRDLRQTLSPVFTRSKLQMMSVLMEECAKQLTDYFLNQQKDILEVELKDVTTRFTNDVIASAAFGIKCNSLEDRKNDFYMAGKELTDFTGLKRLKFFVYANYPILVKLLKLKFISARVGNFFKSVITETIKLREEKNIIRPDLIHLMMLAKKGKLKYEDYMNLEEAGFAAVEEAHLARTSKKVDFLTDEDITAQALIFFFAGFDSVSSLMCFSGYELAANPQIQERLKREIRQCLQECDGRVTYEHLVKLKYLDMFISEVLRKWPQAIFTDRKCTKTFVIEPERKGEEKVTVNVGDVCWIPVFALHRDPKFYPNPDVFDPERFSDENKHKIPMGAYLPFGSGPRNCIGSRFALLETKLFIFHLLSKFEIVPTEKTQIPLKLNRNNVMLDADKGFHVGLKRSQ